MISLCRVDIGRTEAHDACAVIRSHDSHINTFHATFIWSIAGQLQSNARNHELVSSLALLSGVVVRPMVAQANVTETCARVCLYAWCGRWTATGASYCHGDLRPCLPLCLARTLARWTHSCRKCRVRVYRWHVWSLGLHTLMWSQSTSSNSPTPGSAVREKTLQHW